MDLLVLVDACAIFVFLFQYLVIAISTLGESGSGAPISTFRGRTSSSGTRASH
jgi:hypothetical protein